jgi:hypothetical protein
MGRGGEQLHDWMFEGRSVAEAEALEIDHFSGIGALIIGRRMADPLHLRRWAGHRKRTVRPKNLSGSWPAV